MLKRNCTAHVRAPGQRRTARMQRLADATAPSYVPTYVECARCSRAQRRAASSCGNLLRRRDMRLHALCYSGICPSRPTHRSAHLNATERRLHRNATNTGSNVTWLPTRLTLDPAQAETAYTDYELPGPPTPCSHLWMTCPGPHVGTTEGQLAKPTKAGLQHDKLLGSARTAHSTVRGVMQVCSATCGGDAAHSPWCS